MLLKADLFWCIFILYSKVNGIPTLTGLCADPEGHRLRRPSLTPHMLLKADLFWCIFILYSKVNGTPTLIGHWADPEGHRLGSPS